ncbi:TonB-dependent receptor plug domain-containing protein [Desulfolithobacter sp.]
MQQLPEHGRPAARRLPLLVSALSLSFAATAWGPYDAWATDSPEPTLEEVVVTATRTPHTPDEVPVETVVVSRQDIEHSTAENVVDLLGTIPGISTSVHDDIFGTYTWRATMRGLNFNDGYALILVDGQRVLGAGQSGGMGEYGIGLNQIPLDMIERIEVVKGPGSALYGSDAVAGVINIITRTVPRQPSAWAGATYGWYWIQDRIRDGVIEQPSDHGHSRTQSQAHIAFGDHPLDRVGYLFQYGYESAEDTGADPIRSDRHSVMTKVDLEAGDRLDISLKGEASRYEKEDNREENSYRISASSEYHPADNRFFSLSGYRYDWDFVHGYPGFSYGYKHGTITFNQAGIQHTWYLNGTHTLVTGGEMEGQNIDYVIENSDGSIITVEEDIVTASLYGQDEIQITDDLVVVAGLRWDDHSTFGNRFNPKLSVMYTLSDATTIRASAGQAFKSPTIRQLYYGAPYRHGSYYAISNPDLAPETALGYSATLEHRFPSRDLTTSLGLFRNEVDDMVIREDTNTLYNGLPLLEYRNVEEAITQGVELSFNLEAGNFSLKGGYTYTDTENRDTDRELTYVPDHSLSLMPAYRWQPWQLDLSMTITYTGRQYTDLANTARIDPHTVVDMKVIHHLGQRTRLSLELDNILDSDHGDKSNYRTGRSFLIRIDTSF